MANVTEMTDWADLPEILTIDEVAAYLRYSRKTIRRMIDDGRGVRSSHVKLSHGSEPPC